MTTNNLIHLDRVTGRFDAGIDLGEFLDGEMIAVRVSTDQRAAIVCIDSRQVGTTCTGAHRNAARLDQSEPALLRVHHGDDAGRHDARARDQIRPHFLEDGLHVAVTRLTVAPSAMPELPLPHGASGIDSISGV